MVVPPSTLRHKEATRAHLGGGREWGRARSAFRRAESGTNFGCQTESGAAQTFREGTVHTAMTPTRGRASPERPIHGDLCRIRGSPRAGTARALPYSFFFFGLWFAPVSRAGGKISHPEWPREKILCGSLGEGGSPASHGRAGTDSSLGHPQTLKRRFDHGELHDDVVRPNLPLALWTTKLSHDCPESQK